jgi:hypothetical protein
VKGSAAIRRWMITTVERGKKGSAEIRRQMITTVERKGSAVTQPLKREERISRDSATVEGGKDQP